MHTPRPACHDGLVVATPSRWRDATCLQRPGDAQRGLVLTHKRAVPTAGKAAHVMRRGETACWVCVATCLAPRINLPPYSAFSPSSRLACVSRSRTSPAVIKVTEGFSGRGSSGLRLDDRPLDDWLLRWSWGLRHERHRVWCRVAGGAI